MVWQGLLLALSPTTLITIFVGVFLGIIVGIVPGVGAGVGLALLLPIIFQAPPLIGLMLLLALWAADGYGASLTSILINVPGGPGAVATSFDGYPMAQQGKASIAIGLSMASSMVAGIIGTIVLMVASPPLAELAVKMGPAEYTVMAIFGLTIIGGLTAKDPLKGLIAAGFGLLISFMGYDLLTGFVRFSFGWQHLYDGIDFGLAVIGVFAVGSLVDAAQEGGTISAFSKVQGSTWEGFKLAFKKYPMAMIRGSLVGAILGILPGIGISISSLVAYDVEKRVSKHPEMFGHGAPEGVIGPEAANNSVQPANLIPVLTLGIPGGATSAVFLGALIMYGLTPGLDLFRNQGNVVWGLFWGIIIASIAYVVVGMLFANFFAKVTLLPVEYLIPVTLVTCFVGAFSLNGKFPDMVLMVGMGVVGYLMLVLKYPVAPAVLGVVLGPMLERNYFRSLLISGGTHKIFFQGTIVWVLWALTAFSIIYPYIVNRNEKKKGKIVTEEVISG